MKMFDTYSIVCSVVGSPVLPCDLSKRNLREGNVVNEILCQESLEGFLAHCLAALQNMDCCQIGCNDG